MISCRGFFSSYFGRPSKKRPFFLQLRCKTIKNMNLGGFRGGKILTEYFAQKPHHEGDPRLKSFGIFRQLRGFRRRRGNAENARCAHADRGAERPLQINRAVDEIMLSDFLRRHEKRNTAARCDMNRADLVNESSQSFLHNSLFWNTLYK